jgi:nicotinamide mononucleotide transporter
MDIFENIYKAILTTTIWEWMAVLCGLLYVILISFKKISAWFFAVISSALYIYLCYMSQLYLETGLHVFYLAMGLYGWHEWTEDSKDHIEPIIRWPLKFHLINIVGSTMLMFILGYLFDTYTDQMNPYADAFTTVFSLAATFMITRKVLENWIYWIIINIVNTYLFASRDLYLSSALFVLYTVIAVYGFFNWSRIHKQQRG